MRYPVFLRELSRVDGSSPDYHDLAAGFLALRQFDIWLDNPGLVGEANVAMTIKRIRLADPRMARLLTAAVRGLIQSTNASQVVGPFLAYGMLLMNSYKYGLATDVFEMSARAIEGPWMDVKDHWLSVSCYTQLCMVYTARSDWSAAELIVRRAKNAIRRCPPEMRQSPKLSLAFREAVLLGARGDIEDSFEKLSHILRATKDRSHLGIRTYALLERGRALNVLGRPNQALGDLLEAMRLVESDRLMHGTLADIAATLLAAGAAHQTSFRVLAFLSQHGKTPYLRSYTTANLIEVVSRFSTELGIQQPWIEAQRWWEVFRHMEHPIASVELDGALMFAQAADRAGERKTALKTYQDVYVRASRLGFQHIATTASNALSA